LIDILRLEKERKVKGKAMGIPTLPGLDLVFGIQR
jgi:hypothetical protein